MPGCFDITSLKENLDNPFRFVEGITENGLKRAIRINLDFQKVFDKVLTGKYWSVRIASLLYSCTGCGIAEVGNLLKSICAPSLSCLWQGSNGCTESTVPLAHGPKVQGCCTGDCRWRV